MANIELVLCDVGGVLGTNGWDHEQRAVAIERFGLNEHEFALRHHEANPSWEEGRLTIDEYLDLTVFYEPRAFSRDEFRTFMLAQSQPFPDSIALMRALRATHRYRMMTLNNESSELNQYRIATFGLVGVFDAFLTSCYLTVRKPIPALYTRALAIAHAVPAQTVFIDDREQNLAPARALGIHTILFTSAVDTMRQLHALGVMLDGIPR